MKRLALACGAFGLVVFSGIAIPKKSEKYLKSSPLHKAVLDGNVDRVKKLLGEGIHPDVRNVCKWTALEMGLTAEIDNFYRPDSGRPPNSDERLIFTKPMVTAFEEAGGEVELPYLILLGEWDRLQKALAEGADPNRKVGEMSPLFVAACVDDRPAMRLLLEAGAEVHTGFDYIHSDLKGGCNPGFMTYGWVAPPPETGYPATCAKKMGHKKASDFLEKWEREHAGR